MIFVSGGTFQGKRKWVKNRYNISLWLNGYDSDSISQINTYNNTTIVIEGLERYIYQSMGQTIEIVRDCWKKSFSEWMQLEKERNIQIVIIGCDISKGIVPIEEFNRNWRDLTGWVYQDLASIANEVYFIWAGISTKFK